jgi:Flp pilus assembly protein TadG
MKNTINQKGSVLVFVTLMIVLLMVMVGMGLDTGHLAYVRSQGQPAVDASALAAASAVSTRDDTAVKSRAGLFNSSNTYLSSKNNTISGTNVTYAYYDPASTPSIKTSGIDVTNANAVRVALETTNPHTGAAANTSMASPLFLTPLFNVMGINTKNTANVSVSAVAALRGLPGLPLAIELDRCDLTKYPNPQKLLQSSSKTDNSGYTTYWIDNASATEIKGLLKSSFDCGSAIPSVDTGYCTQLNNGQIASVYEDFESLFKATYPKCYLLPVVKNGANWNQCQNIEKWASFCADKDTPVVKEDSNKYIYGTIDCNNITVYNQNNLNCYVPTLVRDTKSGM